MNIKTLLPPLLVVVFLLGSAMDATAQRRKKKKRRTDRTEERDRRAEDGAGNLKEKITYELGLGNIAFFNRNFEAGLKAGVGYKLNKVLTAGVGGKYIFNIVSTGVESATAHRLGFYPFVNIKVYDGFYAKGLYEFGRYDQLFSTGGGRLFKETGTVRSPWAGIGRVQGFDKWNFGFELLFPLSEEVRTNYVLVEYWAMFTYNF